MLAFTDSIGQGPRGALFAIRLNSFFLLRFHHSLVPTHIDEGLLVEELLLLVTDHLLGSRLDTEAGNRLD